MEYANGIERGFGGGYNNTDANNNNTTRKFGVCYGGIEFGGFGGFGDFDGDLTTNNNTKFINEICGIWE